MEARALYLLGKCSSTSLHTDHSSPLTYTVLSSSCLLSSSWYKEMGRDEGCLGIKAMTVLHAEAQLAVEVVSCGMAQ